MNSYQRDSRHRPLAQLTTPLGMVVLFGYLLTACSGSDTPRTNLDEITLCDESEGLKLAYRVQSQIDRIPPGEQVMVENGHEFLLVDGQCRYWVFPSEDDGTSDSIWSDVVTGQLAGAQEERLKEDIAFVQWQRWNGQLFARPDSNDTTRSTFWTPEATFQCEGGCGDESRQEIRSNLRRWIRDLAQEGKKVEGPLRLQAIVMPDDILRQDRPHPIQAVPSGLAFQDYAISGQEAVHTCFGQGVKIAGEATSTLRQYRQAYRSGVHGDFWYRYLPLEDEDGTVYMVYLRDTVPHENADGLVELNQVPRQSCPIQAAQ